MEHFTTTQVADLADKLFDKHDLDWNFGFDNAKRRLGYCNHNRKLISVSRNFIAILPKEKIEDTLLHEIAHALVGVGHGHDAVWQRKALEIGCDGNRLYKGGIKVKGKYTLTCPNCGTTSYRHKKGSNGQTTACAKCCNEHNGGRYSSDYVFKWEQNY